MSDGPEQSPVDPIEGRDPEQMVVEILRLRDLLAGAEAEIGQLSTHAARLEARLEQSDQYWRDRLASTNDEASAIEAARQELLESTSWKIGQAVLSPVGWWRRTIAARR